MTEAEAILRGFAALIRALADLKSSQREAGILGALTWADRLDAEAQAIAERESLGKKRDDA